MLTEQSYIIGGATYLVAGGAGVVTLYATWLRALPTTARRLFAGICAGLLLMPAYPSPEAQTLAPALIVAVFNTVVGDGLDSALQAIKLLAAGASFGAMAGVVAGRLVDALRASPAGEPEA